MKRIQYIAFALVLLLPFGVSAATFSVVPSVASIKLGSTVTSSVYVNPGAGETITATKVSLVFPAGTLEVLSYSPVTGGSILAHLGTKTNNTAGTVVDNVAFNPGITVPTKVATITFKAKKDGNAKVTFATDSTILDSSNANKNVGSATAVSFTVKAPTPPTPPKVTPKVKPVVHKAATQNVSAKHSVTPSVKKVTKPVAAVATSTTAASSTVATSSAAEPAAASGNGAAGETVPYAVAAGVIVLALLVWLNKEKLFRRSK